MSAQEAERIAYRTMYDKPYSPLLAAFEAGDVAYLHYFGEYGHNRIHGVVTDVNADGTEVVFLGRYGNEYTLTTDDEKTTLETDREYTPVENDSIYHLARVPEAMAADPEWSEWEVHLCVSLAHESSDDQVLYPEAASREQAIALAQRRADRDLPEVGPVYNEGQPPEVTVN